MRGNLRTPDIFVKKDNIIAEVKTIHRSNEVEKGRKSGEIFKFNEAKRIQDDIYEELEKYGNRGIKYPLVVVVCPDFIKPPIVTPDDFETVLFYRCDRLIFNGKLRRTPDVQYLGLYFLDEGRHASILSGVGFWERRGILFYENPNAYMKIRKSRFLDFFKKR